MALSNYTLSFSGNLSPSPFVPPHQIQPREQYSDLLYSPEQQHNPDTYKNDPYSRPEQPPRQERRPKIRKRTGPTYLPPQNQYSQYPQHENPNPYSQHNIYQPPRLPVDVDNQRLDEVQNDFQSGFFQGQGRAFDGFPNFPGNPSLIPPPFPPTPSPSYFSKTTLHSSFEQAKPVTPRSRRPENSNFGRSPPIRQQPSGFTKVEAGGSDGKTRLHAVLDYDDDYYDDGSQNVGGLNVVNQQVTPVQGPILLKNGSVPVVPLFSYPTVNNGTLFQIPIFWTALSVALGYELQGQVIKGVPCVKRNYQLYCPTAGNTYPLDKIEHFIDENKALIKRMYGSFSSVERGKGGGGVARRKRTPGVPDPDPGEDFLQEPDPHLGDSYFRHIRQASTPPLTTGNNDTKRVDVCESKTEIITPYWALNSARKLRAIVNTMHFEQAIHQEVCSKTTTARCTNDCGCEQKYKWHRLLAYDPDEDCAGIFMDWFLFPSCCVCRCNP